jgi:hypothetical protein
MFHNLTISTLLSKACNSSGSKWSLNVQSSSGIQLDSRHQPLSRRRYKWASCRWHLPSRWAACFAPYIAALLLHSFAPPEATLQPQCRSLLVACHLVLGSTSIPVLLPLFSRHQLQWPLLSLTRRKLGLPRGWGVATSFGASRRQGPAEFHRQHSVRFTQGRKLYTKIFKRKIKYLVHAIL